MSRTTSHTLETTFEFEEEIESHIKLTYFYTPPTPQCAPSYSSGGEPPEGARVETISLEVEGKPSTFEQFDIAQTSDSLWDKMIDHAENSL